MPFLRPTLSEITDRIRTDIEARLPGADSRLRRSVLDVFARVWAAAIAGLHGYLDWIARQMLPDTADGDHLARWSAIWGMRRTAATAASGDVLVTGAPGTEILAGTLLARADGTQYRVTEGRALAAGATAIPVAATMPGISGVMQAGQIVQFVTPVIGVNAYATVAAAGLGGGAEEEDDEALRSRLLERIRTPPHGGAKSDYLRWMKEVAGVTRAWVYPEWMGAGTVGCTFVMDGRADIIPLPADVDAVAAYLDPLRPVTARPIVFAPTPRPLDMVLRVTPDSAAVRAAIEAEITDLLVREAEPGAADGSSILLISHVREALSVAAGEHDHELVVPAGNIAVAPGEILEPGTFTWIDG